jgi:hypothetical protein
LREGVHVRVRASVGLSKNVSRGRVYMGERICEGDKPCEYYIYICNNHRRVTFARKVRQKTDRHTHTHTHNKPHGKKVRAVFNPPQEQPSCV